jgi:hypothetical protein
MAYQVEPALVLPQWMVVEMVLPEMLPVSQLKVEGANSDFFGDPLPQEGTLVGPFQKLTPNRIWYTAMGHALHSV